MPAAEAVSPASPSTSAARISPKRHLPWPAADGPGNEATAAGGPDGPDGPRSAGPRRDSPRSVGTGLLPAPGFSGWMATTECYGLRYPAWARSYQVCPVTIQYAGSD